MGLDAVVYRSKKHIEMGRDEERAKIDPQTGEVYFEDLKLSKKYYSRREAISHRLGNVSAIAELGSEVSRLIGPSCLTGQKVLYSGSHSGDTIPVKDLFELSAELQAIRRSGRGSPLLLEFVGAMEELIKAANEESNPIVFE